MTGEMFSFSAWMALSAFLSKVVYFPSRTKKKCDASGKGKTVNRSFTFAEKFVCVSVCVCHHCKKVH